MSFPVSTVPAFTAALKAGLEARTGLKGVKVCDGPASVGDLGRSELIELGDVTDLTSVLALDVSTQPRNEENLMTILVSVIQAGRANQTTVNARAFVLVGELDQLLRGDRGLVVSGYTGPGTIYGARIVSMNHTKRVDEKATRREAAVSVGVKWTGRI